MTSDTLNYLGEYDQMTETMADNGYPRAVKMIITDPAINPTMQGTYYQTGDTCEGDFSGYPVYKQVGFSENFLGGLTQSISCSATGFGLNRQKMRKKVRQITLF